MPNLLQLVGCVVQSNQFGGASVLKSVLRFSAFMSPANQLSQMKLGGGMRRLLVAVSMALVAVLLMQPIASAQSQFANLSGSVKDGTGAVVAGPHALSTDSASTDTPKT